MVNLMTAPEVAAALRCSRAQVYVLIRRDGFPRPVKIGQRNSAWLASEVAQWIEEQATARVGQP